MILKEVSLSMVLCNLKCSAYRKTLFHFKLHVHWKVFVSSELQ